MLIHLEKLGKSFGEKIVLHDVTASVEREDRIGYGMTECAPLISYAPWNEIGRAHV